MQPFKKHFFSLAVLGILSVTCSAQTQGDVEDQWVRNVYVNNYTPGIYKKFNGQITKKDNNFYQFGDRILAVIPESEFEIAMLAGLFYPQLINGDSIIRYSPDMGNFGRIFQNDSASISSIKKIVSEKNDFTKRKFSFYFWGRGFANPSLYTIEFTNRNATNNTSVKDFYKNAQLTFLKFISILI